MDDKKEIDAFYAAVGEVCTKFGVRGMVGMWFVDVKDHYGFIEVYPPADTDMRLIVKGIGNKFSACAGEIKAATDNNEPDYRIDMLISKSPDKN